MSEIKESTAEFILRKVSPVFNQKGFVGTSLSDLERATGLTKGAIYRNFESKEDLAIKAFKFNIKKVIAPLDELIKKSESSIQKLFIITVYYRRYFDNVSYLGGCPLLNMGIDTHYTNPGLFKLSKKVASNLENSIIEIIEDGMSSSELKSDLEPIKYARRIFSMIEGGVFLSFLNDDKSYLDNSLDQIDEMIKNEMIS
jgi:TetR/AcrR family transcriptional repressor of nem operon